MLDVHPPHAPTHTWRDFLLHIATICVGLLIAIGLEQTVEALHHRHERRELEEQMLTESERNLDLVKAEIAFTSSLSDYLDYCLQAVQAAPVSKDAVLVTLPVNHASLPSGMLISPSQGTWTVARASGTVALLPAEEAKVYARLNLAADFEQAAEIATASYAKNLSGALARGHFNPGTSRSLILSPTQRDDLIYAYSQSREAFQDLRFRLVILEGALDAVLAHVPTLEEMYPYQERALKRENAQASISRSANAPRPAAGDSTPAVAAK